MQKNHNRHSTRLKGYDYTQAGGFFVTICTKGWVHLFGDIQNGEMIINNLGRIVQLQWLDLPKHYAGVELDDFIVMPNHVHGVIIINGIVTTKTILVGAGLKPAPTNTKKHGLPELIRSFKTFSARKIHKVYENQPPTIWQRGYFDRVIRNVNELDRIREYIRANPENFGNEDSYY